MNVRNFRIGTRLWLGFGLVIALLAAVVAISLVRMAGTQQRIDNILDDRYRKIALATEVKYNVAVIHQRMRNLVIAEDAESVKREAEAINAIRATNKGLLDTFDKIINVPRAREIFNNIVEARKKDLEGQQELLALLAAGNQAEAKTFLKTRIAENEKVYVKLLTDMTELQTGKMAEESRAVKEESAMARTLLLAIAGAAMAIAFAAAWYATRSITRPVNEAVQLARRVADGDLSVHIEVQSQDETGQLMQALKEMNESLVRIVAEVRQGCDTIATATEEIAAGNLDLSSRTEQQASSLEETASSMEELTSTVRQNADNAMQANRLAATASEIAVKGGSVVSEVVHTMGTINESAKRIVEIISVIDGIAFQTNILALNAAVEAARAGEQGRGFAVVASEVRNLAQRSAAAAKEIKELIGDSVEKVEAGTRLVDQAGVTMNEVVESVKRVTGIISEITEASREQTSGIEQINVAITQMDDVTQRNASLVEEAAAAAEALKSQAGKLVQLVNVFRLDEAQKPMLAYAAPKPLAMAPKRLVALSHAG
jgi:methyl-accepting chemotaxis protein